MTDHNLDTLLDHGFVAPVETPLTARREILSARTYHHPGLPEESPVVRLATGSLGEAEDTAMANLGFAGPATARVGVVRPGALRFPEWLLVHDPAHFPLALQLAKQLEGVQKLAGRKPARARAEIAALASRLGAASPQALPGFYEQAARLLLGAEQANAASALFAAAREAEREHGVPAASGQAAGQDEARFALFLEFAQAGALSVKVLAEYLRELESGCAPDTAYRRYRRLSMERVVRGLVPQADLAAALRRLAADAKADVAAESVRLCIDLLQSQPILRARAGFWRGLRPTLVEAAALEPRIRGLLLDLMPKIPGTPNDVGDELWLELLRDCGAFAALTDPPASVPPAASPSDGAAGWLGRFGRHMLRNWYYAYDAWGNGDTHERCSPLFRELLRAMAPRLKAEGVPVRLEWHNNMHLDLVNRCLAAGIPLLDPGERLWANRPQLEKWGAPDQSDLRAFAADPRYGPLLRQQVEKMLVGGSGGWPSQTYAWLLVPGLGQLAGEWLDQSTEQLRGFGMAELEYAMPQWRENEDHGMLPYLRTAAPESWRRFADLDVIGKLAASLRLGILDEYGWPALEEACEGLSATEGERPALSVVDQWPYLVVTDRRTAVVVAHDREVHRERLADRPEEAQHQLLLRWTQGRLEIEHVAADAPGVMPGSAQLPDGSRTFGAEPFRAGAAVCRQHGAVATDGERYWTIDDTGWLHGMRGAPSGPWRRFDPATGELGELSVPELFDRGFVDERLAERYGEAIRLRPACSLFVLPEAVTASPLGRRGALAGWHTVRGARVPGRGGVDHRLQAGIGIDGREAENTRPFETFGGADPLIVGAIRFPGAPDPLPITWHVTRVLNESCAVSVQDPAGHAQALVRFGDVRPGYAAGTACVAPWRFWHFLTPRDPEGSASLRRVSRAQVEQLVRRCAGRDGAGMLEAVEHTLPAVTHPSLRAGVRGYVGKALAVLAELTRLDRVAAAGAAGLDTTAPDSVPVTPSPESDHEH